MNFHAYAAHSQGAQLRPFEYEEAELGPWQLVVRITHCGICHSDVHLIDNVGGLGHLSLQFARAFGCEVTAFSTRSEKHEEARGFGAHHFVLSDDASAMRKEQASLDVLICTVHAELDWAAWFRTLRPKGTLCFLSGLAGPVNIPTGALMSGHRSITGSTIGDRSTMTEMLECAALHGIGARVEKRPITEVNLAVQRVREGRARYRMVLEM